MCELFDVAAIVTLILLTSRIVDYSLESSRLVVPFLVELIFCLIVLGLRQIICEQKSLDQFFLNSFFISMTFFAGFYFLKKTLLWLSSRY